MALPWNLLMTGAKLSDLDVDLVAAIAMFESQGKAWMTRYDPTFKRLVNIPSYAKSRMISEETETIHQKTAWGYLQVFGGAARDLGFNGDLPELSRPSTGLRWGCARLKTLVERVGIRSIEDIISAWGNLNGSVVRDADGTHQNHRYVVGVMRYYNQLNQQD